MSENRKKISIASNGPLPIYGGIFGPIRSPFYETIQNISSLISSGAEVYEHVDGKKVRLDMVNFDKFPSTEAKAKVAQANVNQKAQEQKAAKNEDIIKIPAQNQNYKNDKKNKHNNNNNQQQQAQVEKAQEQQAAPVVDEVVVEA